MTQDWGPHTWKMFHTLVNKVKPEYFNEVKNDLIYFITHISYSLPCPYCSSHARTYFKKIKINSLHTKDDVIKMVFNFHNNVNNRLKKPIFSYDDLNKTYDHENTIQVVNTFVNRYSISSRRTNLFYIALSCKELLSKFINWFQSNLHAFEK